MLRAVMIAIVQKGVVQRQAAVSGVHERRRNARFMKYVEARKQLCCGKDERQNVRREAQRHDIDIDVLRSIRARMPQSAMIRTCVAIYASAFDVTNVVIHTPL